MFSKKHGEDIKNIKMTRNRFGQTSKKDNSIRNILILFVIGFCFLIAIGILFIPTMEITSENKADDTVTEKAEHHREWTIPSLGMQLVYVETGSFQMGANDGSKDYVPEHKVTISRGYWIGKYEVTKREYHSVMSWVNLGFASRNKPVEDVSWNDAMKFCKKLTERERKAGRLPPAYEYRLPTEAEWEFAARGGNKSKSYTYSGSNNINDVACYYKNSHNNTFDVGTKAPNELGIHDMSGNLLEWSLDHCNWNSKIITSTYKDGIVDPFERAGPYRINRNGSWGHYAKYCKVTRHGIMSPETKTSDMGFRVVLAHNLNVHAAGLK